MSVRRKIAKKLSRSREQTFVLGIDGCPSTDLSYVLPREAEGTAVRKDCRSGSFSGHFCAWDLNLLRLGRSKSDKVLNFRGIVPT